MFRKLIIGTADNVVQLIFLLVIAVGIYAVYEGVVQLLLAAIGVFILLSLMAAAFFCLVEIAENSRAALELIKKAQAIAEKPAEAQAEQTEGRKDSLSWHHL